MCITFLQSSVEDEDSDYNFILVSNRDEVYARPTMPAAEWAEDSYVIGGRDMEPGCEGGTWLALSPHRQKLGVLLNVPGYEKTNAKSRGKIVEDFVHSDKPIEEYVEKLQEYGEWCQGFNMIAVQFSNVSNKIYSYNNITKTLQQWSATSLGFSNSLPEAPLSKASSGALKMKEICHKYKKLDTKAQLIDELVNLMKSGDRYLPDCQLEKRSPKIFDQLSSIFVSIPHLKYGTRTHTIVLVTKDGHITFIELTMKTPVDGELSVWIKSEFSYEL